MTYALNRFQPPVVDRSIVESIQEAVQAASLSGNLATLVARKKKQMAAQERVTAIVKLLKEKTQAEDQAPNLIDSMVSPLRRIITKILTFTAKKIFKYIVKPVLRFAARVMMNVVRVVLQGIVRMVIVPAIQLITAFVVANPITFAIGATLLATGGAYWIWDKFFAEKPMVPKVPAQDIDIRGEPETFDDLELEVSADQFRRPTEIQTQAIQEPTELPTSIPSFVQAPIAYVKEQYKKITGKKFTGFGEDVDAYIKEAALKYELPEDVLRGFIKMEGGWTGAMSPTGAIGTGQFIQPTWDSLAATTEGKAIGMTKIGKRFRTPEDPRFNKRINTLATGLLAKQNAAQLTRNGIPVTGENLYMMHNIGPGIIPVMKGQPASAATLKAISQQGGVFKNATAAYYITEMGKKYQQAYQQANSSTKSQGNTPQYTDGQALAKTQKAVKAKTVPAATANTAYASNPDKTLVKQGKKIIELGA